MFRLAVAPQIEIRQLHMAEAEIVFDAVERNRAYLREWLPWVDGTRSPADVRDFISRTIAQLQANQGPSAGVWIGNELVGSIGCHPIDWPNRAVSIGYWIDLAHQGQGIITRCSVAMLDYLFDTLNLHRVEIRCGQGNTRSCAIPERLGFTREGVVRGGQWVNDRWVDLLVWGMLEHEWRARWKA